MSALTLRAARFSKITGGLFAILFIAGNLASAEDVLLIEEHWKLEVGGADAARSAPQVTMVMSPTNGLSDDFFIVSLNHWSYPDFAPGGIQLQRWHDKECLAVTQGNSNATMDHEEEVVTWVQRISLVEGHLKFEILNGTSQTWGSFGASGNLVLTVPTSLTRLNDYRPAVSLEQSESATRAIACRRWCSLGSNG